VVVDIMPHTVESVYFFWDTNYAHLRLGIWSAQKEIEFAKSLPGVNYYNLGSFFSSHTLVSFLSSPFVSSFTKSIMFFEFDWICS
jgi:arginyl-tRNA--protein-N-Asp/Glu arginylyltransferase